MNESIEKLAESISLLVRDPTSPQYRRHALELAYADVMSEIDEHRKSIITDYKRAVSELNDLYDLTKGEDNGR